MTITEIPILGGVASLISWLAEADIGSVSLTLRSGLTGDDVFVVNEFEASDKSLVASVIGVPVYAVGSVMNSLSAIILGVVDAVFDGVREILMGIVTLKPLIGLACAIRSITDDAFCITCMCGS